MALVKHFVASAVLMLSMPINAFADVVDHVAVTATPSRYDGRCPASIEFIARIFVNHRGVISYRRERSDGGAGPIDTIDVNRGEREVTAHWDLRRSPGEIFHGSETLHVMSPEEIHSRPANFTLICR